MKTIYKVSIILMSVVVLVGAGLLIWVLLSNKNSHDVELESEGVTTKELVYTAENFLPGETREYAVNVHSAEAGDYSVSFSCTGVGEGVLWQFLDVEIVFGEISKEVAFAELIGGSSLDFDINLERNVPMSFTIRYKMPKEVGNEAEKERTDFVLLMTAERK